MKKTILSTLGAAALLCACQGQAHAQMLIINEVYPGGGSGTVTTTTYTRDFVELYNKSSTPISLAGYNLEYAPASASGDFTAANYIFSFGTGSTIGANDYLSISTGSAGSQGATLTAGSGSGFVTYVNPGASGASLSASSGSVRLVNNTGSVVDLLGYGTVATGPSGAAKSEGTAASSPSSANNMSLNRTNFVDTNSNSADFSSMTPSPNGGSTSAVFAVPEPSVYAVMGLGIMGMFAMLRARRRTA